MPLFEGVPVIETHSIDGDFNNTLLKRGDCGGFEGQNRFSGLSARKTAEAVAEYKSALNTPLKQGVNDITSQVLIF